MSKQAFFWLAAGVCANEVSVNIVVTIVNVSFTDYHKSKAGLRSSDLWQNHTSEILISKWITPCNPTPANQSNTVRNTNTTRFLWVVERVGIIMEDIGQFSAA